MLNTALRFMSECDQVGLKYRDSRDLENGQSVVICGVSGKNNARYEILFFFDGDERTVSLRIFALVNFPEEKTEAVMDIANDLNAHYRWLKFYIDESKVNAQCDAIINDENSGRICVELMLRTMRIIDEIYPRFMHALWG